jgi:zinc protease|tara:strand:- start:67372 stop:70137 length:2766 start_codon:yes stop_codon:yes gene_type:complete
MKNKFLIIIVIFFSGCGQKGDFILNPSPNKEMLPINTDLEISYEQFVLDNGLRVVVHEDRKAPIIATNIWYHVGSMNEEEGKTGFAHLFEHLMFNGSENNNDEFFGPLQKVGATSYNGTTNTDRTNYYQTVPTTAIDLILWLESDRMGHLLGAIDQEKLDEQRGVVQNEKRQREGQPYGKAFDYITTNVFPKGHPYSWSVIGSMEDLNSATLEDVQNWFNKYYGPNNATIVLAGDIDAKTAREKVEKYFGHIPPGPPIERFETWIPSLSHDRKMVVEDRVPQARIYRTWPSPEWGNPESDLLEVAGLILGEGTTSRLHQRLVYQEQIATDAGTYAMADEIAGGFLIWATAREGESLEKINSIIQEEIEIFLEKGPTSDELLRAKTNIRSDFIRTIERVTGKASVLAENTVYGNSPDSYKSSLERIEKATKEDLIYISNKWLSESSFTLEITPYDQKLISSNTDKADRSSLPYPEKYPEANFPKFETSQLNNGLNLILVERSSVPLIQFSLQFDAGYAADQFGKLGRTSLSMNLLDQGTINRNATEISTELERLGAVIEAGSNLDYSYVNLSALKNNLVPSLEIYSDIILNPSFSEEEIDRQKQLMLSKIRQEQSTPSSMAQRVFPKLLFGENHPYSLPMTGSGNENSIGEIKKLDLEGFHKTWLRPNNATLIIAGDISMEEIKPKLEELFTNWSTKEIPEKIISNVSLPEEANIYLIDRPGADQSYIFTGHIFPPKSNDLEESLQAMNDNLGGSFTSRINMNLREDKGWSYGIRSVILETTNQRPFITYGSVQTDKTSEALKEMDIEIQAILNDKPVTEEEVNSSKSRSTLSLPSRWETNRSIVNDIARMIRFNLPDNYWNEYENLVNSINVESVNEAAQKILSPDNLTWVIVGDLSLIENNIRNLNLGKVSLIDTEGNLL